MSRITAEDALEQASYWLHFGRSPENALPWLIYAGRWGKSKEDFDEIAKFDTQVQRREPEKYRAFQKGHLRIEMMYHPRYLATVAKQRDQRRGTRASRPKRRRR